MRRFFQFALLVGMISYLSEMASADPIITQWTFSTITPAPDNSPAPTTGSGTASVLGMNNSYTYSNTKGTQDANTVAAADVTAPGLTGSTQDDWRVRGAPASTPSTPGAPNNGWNLAAPQYSQGAQFSVDTTGYTGIKVSFDWGSTNQGVKDLQEQYTTDGTTWNNIGSVLVATPNGWILNNTIDLSSISAANNDPNFGIRLVSAYDPSSGGTSYSSATSGVYNNSSGNWGFNNVTFTGTASVPEPSSLILVGVAGLGYMARRRAARERAAAGVVAA